MLQSVKAASLRSLFPQQHPIQFGTVTVVVMPSASFDILRTREGIVTATDGSSSTLAFGVRKWHGFSVSVLGAVVPPVARIL